MIDDRYIYGKYIDLMIILCRVQTCELNKKWKIMIELKNWTIWGFWAFFMILKDVLILPTMFVILDSHKNFTFVLARFNSRQVSFPYLLKVMNLSVLPKEVQYQKGAWRNK